MPTPKKRHSRRVGTSDIFMAYQAAVELVRLPGKDLPEWYATFDAWVAEGCPMPLDVDAGTDRIIERHLTKTGLLLEGETAQQMRRRTSFEYAFAHGWIACDPTLVVGTPNLWSRVPGWHPPTADVVKAAGRAFHESEPVPALTKRLYTYDLPESEPAPA